MLQTIREHTQGWISGLIIGVIILSFSLWGIHSYFVGGGNANEAAMVDGTAISKQQLAAAYERLKRQVVAQYGAQALKNDAALKNQALQGLVEFEALKQTSLDEGFRVFGKQVDSYLQAMPEFQVDGQFSLERFQQVLSASSLTTAEFLDIIKANLLVDQPRLGIQLSSFALPNEVLAVASLVNQERDIQYINIPTKTFLAKPIPISPDAIRVYYNQHQADFMTPELVSVEYVELSQKELAAKHQEDKFADIREQLANITFERPDTLKNASDTLGLPIQTSATFTIDKGGDDISQYQAVRDAAFSKDVLLSQNNSDVVQISPDTVIVLRIKTHQASSVLPLNQVKGKIEETLKKEKAQEQAAALATDLQKQLENGANPATLAAQHQLSLTQVGFVGRYSNKMNAGLLDLAFRITKFGTARSSDGYAVVGVKSIKAGELNAKDKAVFEDQVQNSEGALEYALYKQSAIEKAKIKYYQ